jgi:hypothetical protein
VILYHPEQRVSRKTTRSYADLLLGADVGWTEDKPEGWDKPTTEIKLDLTEKRDLGKARSKFKTSSIAAHTRDVQLVSPEWESMYPRDRAGALGQHLVTEALQLFEDSKIMTQKSYFTKTTGPKKGKILEKWQLLIDGKVVKTWTEDMF